jgi:hypothetical protein
MRGIKITSGLVAAFAAVAVWASSAPAHDFTAHIEGKTISPTEPAKTKGHGVGNQHFKFGAIKIDCPVVTTTGPVTEEVQGKLKVIAKYKSGVWSEPGAGCETEIKVGGEPAGLPTKFKSAIEYVFNADGIEAEVGTGGEFEDSEGSVEVGKNAAEIKTTGGVCLVSWPAQRIPLKFKKVPNEVASYSPQSEPNSHIKLFPSGFQTVLYITPNFQKMEWSFEEGRCTEFEHTEGTNGSYEGTIRDELVKGNLSWE